MSFDQATDVDLILIYGLYNSWIFLQLLKCIPSHRYHHWNVALIAFEFMTTKFLEHEILLYISPFWLVQTSKEAQIMANNEIAYTRNNETAEQIERKYFNAAKNVKEWP